MPYPIESALFGVMKPLKPEQRLWYRRQIAIPEAWRGQRIRLHFGAVDWQTTQKYRLMVYHRSRHADEGRQTMVARQSFT